MKTELDFNVPIKQMDGSEEEGSNLGKALAQIIGSNPDGDAWKFGSWAMDVYQGKKLDLDKTDADLLKAWFVRAQFPAFIKMQALQVFE